MDTLFNEIAYRQCIQSINTSTASEHTQTFRSMAKINQVIVPISIGSALSLVLSCDDWCNKLKKGDLTKIAVVISVCNSVWRRDGNRIDYYIIKYPFSDTPEKVVFMTNQGWEPIEVDGRKVMCPTVKTSGDNWMGLHEIIYEPIDYDATFSKEEQELTVNI